jgi:hypothetical protein
VEQIELQLDGVLSEPAWATAEAITNMRTIEPEEGGDPVGKTIVKILVSPKEIVLGFICNDPEPSGIISFSKARDAELDDEDHVLVVLDTFLDGRSGYVFAVNPSGTRFEGLVSAQGTPCGKRERPRMAPDGARKSGFPSRASGSSLA